MTDLDAPELSDGDRHHLGGSLRLRTGDALTVSDGQGRWRACRFGPTLEPAGPIELVPPAAPALTIGFALVKGQRPEWVTQKLTELGVDVIRPFVAARSVVRWPADRAQKATARLRVVAREAAMQSRRCRLPEVHEPVAFAAAAASVAGRPGVALAERGGGPPTIERPTVLIGPEGGWTPEERDGRPTVALGPQVLRADTAAVTAAAMLAGLRAGILR